MKKRNRIEIAAKGLFLAATVVLTIVIISIGIHEYKQSQELANVASENIIDITNDIKNSDVTQYDGMTIKGADVINFYKKYSGGEKDGFDIIVDNGKAIKTYPESGYGVDKTLIESKTDQDYYIYPLDSYKCTVTINNNDVLTKVTFTVE